MIATAVNRDLGDPELAAQLAGRRLRRGRRRAPVPERKARDWVVTSGLSGSHVSGTPAAMLRLQRSSARYYQRPDAPHLSVDPVGHVDGRLEPPGRLQQGEREVPAERLGVGREPGLRGQRPRVPDERGPRGARTRRSCGATPTPTGSPASGSSSSRSGTRGTAPTTSSATGSTPAPTSSCGTTGRWRAAPTWGATSIPIGSRAADR